MKRLIVLKSKKEIDYLTKWLCVYDMGIKKSHCKGYNDTINKDCDNCLKKHLDIKTIREYENES